MSDISDYSSPVLSIDEAKELLSLCRRGKLFEVQNWIQSGKSLRVPRECRRTPLEVAVEVGFHSLVELLAIHESQVDLKNRALLHAVSERKREIAELLVTKGAEVSSIPLLRVLQSWDPGFIRYFLEGGVNALADAPFAEAFGERIRTSLRPFVEHKRAHPEIADALQSQADQALRYFSCEGDLKWVSLMLWAGADPRSFGPKLYEKDDPDLYCSALQEACYAGQLEVLKKLKPSVGTDDLVDLLGCAAITIKGDVLSYLIDLGANLNDKPNGGSTALDRCLRHMNFETFHPWQSKRQLKSSTDVWQTMHCTETLLARGARFVPDDEGELKSLLQMLCGFEAMVSVDLLKLLAKYRSCSAETLKSILSAPRMMRHLEEHRRRLALAGLRMPEDKSKKPELEFPYHLLAHYNRDELYARAWAVPIQQLAKQYGISDVGLAKVCRRLRIPMPGRGYWAKKSAGKRVPTQPPLPPVPPRS